VIARRGHPVATGRVHLAVAATLSLVPTLVGCAGGDAPLTRRGQRAAYVRADSMGVIPPTPTLIRAHPRPDLLENSAAALSHTQAGVFFTINDSGNDPLLFALDTTGADRGVWRVHGSTNVDWESASVGPCRSAPNDCVYIGDTGDNQERRSSRVIYRVREPAARTAGFTGDVDADALPYHYADGPHDVEAMYVAPNGDIFLITKRPRADAAGRRRPALIFMLPADAWTQRAAPVVAELVDSLPIVPGSAPLRLITDASLSLDGRTLAVRTYAQIFTFATDSLTGRVRGAIPPGVCNIIALDAWPGEGVTWFGRSGKLLLTSEGQSSPLQVVDCPMPRSTP